MNIAFCYNVKHNQNYAVDANQDDIEFDSNDVINAIESAIKSLGHTVIKIEADNNAFEKLKKHSKSGRASNQSEANKGSRAENNHKDEDVNIDLVFNIAEGLKGDARESQIPLFCEMLGIPYTHSSPTTHAIKLKKHLLNKYLNYEGIKCPKSVLATKSWLKIKSAAALTVADYPLFVKPNQQGSSKGIFNESVVKTDTELIKMVTRILTEFDTEAIIEEYIDGQEFTVAMLANPENPAFTSPDGELEPEILPIIEQKFDFLPEGFNKVAGYELKWIYEDALPNPFDSVVCPAKIDLALEAEIRAACKKIWRLLDVKDAARLDFRYSPQNGLNFIEINTLPGINPDEKAVSYFPYAARTAGLTFKDLIERIIKSASFRYRLPLKV